MHHIPLAFQCIYGCSDEREDGDGKEGSEIPGKREKFLEERREWRLPDLLYADQLVLYGESKEDLRVRVIRFAEVCRRRRLKFNGVKSKEMVMNGEEGLEYEVHIDGICLEHVSEFKYLGCILDVSGIDGVECNRKVASGRRKAGAIRSLVNARD